MLLLAVGSKNNFFAGSLGSASQGCRIQCDAASAIAVSHDPGRKKLSEGMWTESGYSGDSTK